MSNSCSRIPKCCALCQSSLTAANVSSEHIIPNAIGGRKKVRNFICKNCNSETGITWDSELARQFQLLCVMLNISRQRGRNRPVQVETLSGQKLMWKPDGSLTMASPRLESRTQDGKTRVSIQARSQSDLKKILRDLSRVHPVLNVEELLRDATLAKENLEEPLKLSHEFGGHLAGRSTVKTCLALAYHAGLSRDDCPDAIEYLVSDSQACFGYYNETDPVVRRPENTPLHCVYVCANAETGLILSYVEYFGFQKIIACLSTNYAGPALESCYAVNPITGQELDLKVALDLQKDDIAAVYDYRRFDSDRQIRDLKETLAVWFKMARERTICRILDEAVADACARLNLDPDAVIPDETLPEFVNLLSWSLAQLVLRMRSGSTFSPAELRAINELCKGNQPSSIGN